MRVVLSREYIVGLHVHRRNTEEARILPGKSDLRASIMESIDFNVRCPAFVYAFSRQCTHIFVYRVARAVVSVQMPLEIFPRRPGVISHSPTHHEALNPTDFQLQQRSLDSVRGVFVHCHAGRCQLQR
jgi:hypothetical protein